MSYIKSKAKNIYQRIEKLYHSPKGQWLLAFMIAVLLYALVYLTLQIFLYTHDMNMMKSYSGYRTGVPTSSHPYGNRLIGIAITYLYTVLPSIPWYPIYAVGTGFVSIVIIIRCILSLSHKREVAFVYPIILIVFTFICVLISPISTIIFTLNAVLAGTAAIALIFTAMMASSNMGRIFEFILSFLFIIISATIRFTASVSISCFWLLAITIYIIRMILINKNIIRDNLEQKQFSSTHIFLVILSTMVVLALIFGLRTYNNYLKDVMEPDGFAEYHEMRIEFMDYPIVGYEEAPELFEELEWSEPLYELTQKMYFVDEKFNADTLNAIVTYYSENVEQEGTNTLHKFGKIAAGNDHGAGVTGGIATLSFVALFLLLKKTDRKNHVLFMFCIGTAVVGCIVLSSYLIWQGRFVLRAYQSIGVPTFMVITCAVIMLLPKGKAHLFKRTSNENTNKPDKSNIKDVLILAVFFAVVIVGPLMLWTQSNQRIVHWGGLVFLGSVLYFAFIRYVLPALKRLIQAELLKKIILFILAECIVFLGLISMIWPISSAYEHEHINLYTARSNRMKTIENYALENPDNFYIYDSTLSADYRLMLPNTPVSNLMFWGGTMMYTQAYYDQLAANGIAEVHVESILDENIYYMTTGTNEKELLMDYLAQELVAVKFKLIEELAGGVEVYKISRRNE